MVLCTAGLYYLKLEVRDHMLECAIPAYRKQYIREKCLTSCLPEILFCFCFFNCENIRMQQELCWIGQRPVYSSIRLSERCLLKNHKQGLNATAHSPAAIPSNLYSEVYWLLQWREDLTNMNLFNLLLKSPKLMAITTSCESEFNSLKMHCIKKYWTILREGETLSPFYIMQKFITSNMPPFACLSSKLKRSLSYQHQESCQHAEPIAAT